MEELISERLDTLQTHRLVGIPSQNAFTNVKSGHRGYNYRYKNLSSGFNVSLQTSQQPRLGLCHNTLTPARTRRLHFDLCHNFCPRLCSVLIFLLSLSSLFIFSLFSLILSLWSFLSLSFVLPTLPLLLSVMLLCLCSCPFIYVFLLFVVNFVLVVVFVIIFVLPTSICDVVMSMFLPFYLRLSSLCC